jgi:16S rRNA (uracil1498-N3)-methyltransferase
MRQTTEDLTYPGGLTRFFVKESLALGAQLELDEHQAHQVVHVLRARQGQRVRLFNGTDGEWSATIESISKKSVILALEGQTHPQAGVPDLWLLLAPVKKAPFDFIVQKATELGVARIQPVFTRRTIVDRVNLERMQANVIEAAEQCERLCIPELAEPAKLEHVLSTWDNARSLAFCDEAGNAAPAAKAFTEKSGRRWAILTGPEGGFDATERDAIRALSFTVPVTLGPRIMRADTAAITAIAVWQSTCGDWS